MLILQLAACIGMVSGCFLLFHIRLTDFTTEVFQGLLGRPKNLQDAIREEMHTKKVSYLKRELLEIQDILTATGREKQFPLLCTVAFLLFAAGASAAAVMGNLFLVPVLAVGCLFVPFWYIKITSHSYKKEISEELETALSIITTSYLRNEDILTAVEESAAYLKPPVQTVFLEFASRIRLVDPDVESALKELKTKIHNDTFEEWCELEYMVYEPRKEFITMVVLVVANIPLLYFLNHGWYLTLVATVLGKFMLSVSAALIFFSTAQVIRLTKPIEYRR